MKRTKAYIAPFNSRDSKGEKQVKTIGKTAIEDVILHVQKAKGNPKRGEKIIEKVGCVACHNIKPNTTVKAPDLTKLGNMSKDDIAAAIIKPDATIAASWVTITMNDGTAYTGTVVKSDANEIILHDIAGTPTKIDAKQIKSKAPGLNMMSLHLCDSLNLDEFADLIEYIQSMDPDRKK
jgi:putative heme-binding domain-containing protein